MRLHKILHSCVLLILFLSNSISAQNEPKSMILKMCNTDSIVYSEINQLNDCLNIFIEEESDYKILELLKQLDTFTIEKITNNKDELDITYNLLNLAIIFANKFNEDLLVKKIESKLFNYIQSHPEYLKDKISKLKTKLFEDSIDLHNFIETYRYYLFSSNDTQTEELNLIDRTFRNILNSIIDLTLLKNEFEYLDDYKLIIGEGVSLIKKNIFNKEIVFHYKGQISKKIKNLKSDDIIVIYDYYPLNQWKEPVFKSYNLNSKEKLRNIGLENIYSETNLNRIIK